MAARIRITSLEDPGGFTLFVMSLEHGGRRWDVRKRYSECYAFYQAIQRECSGLEHQFPPKKIGKLNAEQTARRAGQLEAFLQELLDTILSANVKSALLEFLEIKEDMRTSTPPALASSMSPAPPPPPIESLVPIMVEEPPPKPASCWSNDFMSSDPLAQLTLDPPSEKPKPKPQKDASPPRPAKSSGSPTHNGSSTTTGEKPGPAPAFMGSNRAPESYAISGEGLREAIMNRDGHAVKYLLEKDAATLVQYQDRQAETMLHLACIFNLNDIALALVKAGASIETRNAHGETSLDIAQPSLKSKLVAAVKARAAAKLAIRCLYTIAMAEQLQPGSENPHNLPSAHSAASPPAIDDFVAGLFLNDSPNGEGGLLASGSGFDPSSLMGSAADGLDPAMEAFLRLSEPDDIDQIHQQSEAQPQQLPFVVQPSPPPLVYQAPAYGGPALHHQKSAGLQDHTTTSPPTAQSQSFPWGGLPTTQQAGVFMMPAPNAAAFANAGTQGLGLNASTSPEADERRQRRLARNRESARQCRRRKKEYLDLLQDKVYQLNEEIGGVRRAHLEVGLSTLQQLREEHINQLEKKLGTPPLGQEIVPSPFIRHDLQAILDRFGPNAEERRVLLSYRFLQLRDVLLPPHTRFLLWLTHKDDAFFRGSSREASVGPGSGSTSSSTGTERAMSANKRGEKLMQGGRTSWEAGTVLWPLLCYELQVKSDQEERLRKAQLELHKALTGGGPESTEARASVNHGSDAGLDRPASITMTEMMSLTSGVEHRFLESSRSVHDKMAVLHQVLTPLQVVKFELWKDKAKASILRAAARRQAKRGQRVHLPTKVLIT